MQERLAERRLIAAFALAIVVLIVNAVVSIQATQRLIHNEQGMARSLEALDHLETTLSLASDAETGERGYVITGRHEYLAPYDTALRHMSGEVEHLRDLMAGRPDQQELVMANLAAMSFLLVVLYVIARGLAERRHVEAERTALLDRERRARADAEAANRAKDEFLATVTHELRTPLNAILGWSYLLSEGSLDEAGSRRALETIDRNARTQAKLIEDLLDMSRVISGRLRLQSEPVNLIGVIEAAIDAARPAANAKSIELSSNLDPGAAAVTGDPIRLQQVVWNLLANAVKFTDRHGSIRLSLQRMDAMAEFTVRDNGRGIDPAFLPHLFERFRQADSSDTRRHGGMGLGLSIVRHLVELHGGTVEARSEGPGKGATFIVRLPLRTTESTVLSGDPTDGCRRAVRRDPQAAA